MRKVLLAAIACLFLAIPAQAQGPIFLPLVYGAAMPTCEDHWKLIVPAGTTNLVTNPSFETGTTGWTAAGAITATQVTTYAHYGLYSLRVVRNGGTRWVNFASITYTASEPYIMTMRVRHATGRELTRDDVINMYIENVNVGIQSIEPLGDGWYLFTSNPRVAAGGASNCGFLMADQLTLYVDGVQIENLAYPTTYCDGTQEGCTWNGVEHASSSTRSAQSRAGGRVLDFWRDYHFLVERFGGTGMAPVSLSVDDYAILPGGQLNNVKTGVRSFTLTGTFLAENEAALYRYRQALLEELSSDRYVYNQPVRLRFAGADVQKQVSAHFEGGLEAQLEAYKGPFKRDLMSEEVETTSMWRERVVLRFIAADPIWYEIGDSAAVLDTNDSATFRIVAGRLRSTGQWDNLGPPAAVGGASPVIRAIAEDDTYVYFGGDFDNFDNIANADNIVRWNKYTEAWSALGTGVDDTIYALATGADGTLYAGGAFHNAGGGAAAHIAQWDGAAWSALGAGCDDVVASLAVGLDGYLYAGGVFENAGGGAANRIARWNGAAWAALSTGMDRDGVNALAVGIDGSLYAGGYFQTSGGVTTNGIAKWNGTAWSALGTGIDVDSVQIQTLAVGPDGRLYAGGSFTIIDGVTVNYVAVYNNAAWSALSTGLGNTVWDIAVGADGTVYVVGGFTDTEASLEVDYFARWNGASWSHMDINFPVAVGYAVLSSRYIDPVILSYDLYIGLEGSGTSYYGGAATVTNYGIQPAYPSIVVTRSGGTTATLKTIRNETTGQELLFDYDLQDGETLTIDLTPQNKSIISSSYGLRLDAILPNSDFGTFSLLPGANNITAFVDVTGAPTITAYMTWKDAYKSHD